MKILKLLAPVILLAAFGAAHAADDRGAKLNALYSEYWEESLKLSPISATFAGDPRYNDQLPNFLTKEYEDQNHAFEQKYLDKARAIGTDGLSGQDRLSYDIFTLARETELEGFAFPDRLLPIDQFLSLIHI